MDKSITMTAMIECPKGSNQKFDYDPGEKLFKLSKFLPAGLVFPSRQTLARQPND